MTKGQKIALVVGAAAVGYLFLRSRSGSGAAAQPAAGGGFPASVMKYGQAFLDSTLGAFVKDPAAPGGGAPVTKGTTLGGLAGGDDFGGGPYPWVPGAVASDPNSFQLG